MKTMVIGLSFLGLTSLSNAQILTENVGHVQLDKIVVSSMKNSGYYNAVYDPFASNHVKQLVSEVSNYDVKKLDIYSDAYDAYRLMFKNTHGKIIAIYDEDGVVMKSVERYEDIRLPEKIRLTLNEKYPGWHLNSTVYRVNYFKGKDTKKAYKVQIEKDDDKINLKIDCEGVILRSSD